MEIKAADVMKLRKATNAGMMDCKHALQEAEGDLPMFLSSLREHGFSLSISAERYSMPQCTFFWVG